MPVPVIDALPPAPQPTDTPPVFVTKAAAQVAAQAVMVGQINTAISFIDGRAASAEAAAELSTTKASAASLSASAAGDAAVIAIDKAAQASSHKDAAATSAASVGAAAATANAKASESVAARDQAVAAAASAQAIALGVSTGRPSIRPTLLLDIANSGYVDTRITFTRASAATRINRRGLRETVAPGVPRIEHNPLTLACLGLLVEVAATNLAIASDHLSVAAGYGVNNYAVWPHCPESPGLDGALSMTKLTALTTGTSGFWRATSAIAVNTTYILMADFKRGTSTKWMLGASDNVDSGCNVYFNSLDPSNAPVGAPFGGWSFVAAGAYECQSGIWRCWATITSNSSDTVTNLYACPVNTNSNTATAGDSCYVGALDLVTGSVRGSHIPSATSFTGRSSTGTYIDSAGLIQTAAAGAARYSHNPADLSAPPVLLLESAATNRVIGSRQLTHGAWSRSKINIATDFAAGVDGTQVAGKIVEDTQTGQHLLFQVIAVTAGNPYVYSFCVWPAGWTTIQAQLGSGGPVATFDLLSRAATKGAGAVFAGIDPGPNGSLRCWVSGLSNGDGAHYIYKTSANYTGDGVSGIVIDAVQLEDGYFPSSIILTSAASVARAADTLASAATTRSADVPLINGQNFRSFFRSSEGTFVVQSSQDHNLDRYLLSITRGAGNWGPRIQATNSRNPTLNNVNDTSTVDAMIGTATSRNPHTWAIAYKNNDYASAAGGVINGSDGSAAVPTGLVDLRIGVDPVGGSQLNGCIRSIRYYPQRLSNAELIALTA